MDKKDKKLLKRIKQMPIDPLWLELRMLANAKNLYEQNYNLQPNVRMANIQLVQNDIVALRRRIRKRKQKFKF